MWIAGIVVYWLFHLLVFAWYLPESRLRRGTQPMIWFHSWFHPVFIGIAFLLLIISGFLFYLESGWLVFAPIALVFASWFYYIQKARYRVNELIKQSMSIQVSLERLGRSQPEINRAIMDKIFGSDEYLSDVASDFDIRLFIKSCVLSEFGYFDSQAEWDSLMNQSTSASPGQKIDALIDYWRLRLSQ